MADVNDVVLVWGELRGKTAYDEAKRLLVNGRSNSELIADAEALSGGSVGSWNDALILLAEQLFEAGDALLMENGSDALLLETGTTDKILIDFA